MSAGTRTTRVLAIAALVTGSVVLAVIIAGSRDSTYELRASFDDARGLIAGGDVRAGGVTVGTVKSVEIGPGGRPEVTMAVDEDFQVHEGAFADIRLASNLGAVNRTVELIQGDTDDPRLPDGARLTTRETDQPVNFDEAVETLNRPTRRQLGKLLAGLDAAVDGRHRDVDRLLAGSTPALLETADLLAQVNSDGEALRTLVDNGERVVSTLASDPQSLGSAAEQVAALLRVTAGRQRELAASVGALGPALTGGRRALEALLVAIPRLRRSAVRLGPLVDALAPLVRLLPEATAAAGPLVKQTRTLVDDAPRQLAELRPIARAADPVAGKLTGVARAALPLAQVMQVYIPETVGAFQNFGATAGAYDANGHILNVAAGLVVAAPPPSTLAGGEIGPADCDPSAPSRVKPGLLKRPYIRVPGANECQPWTDLPGGILQPPSKGGDVTAPVARVMFAMTLALLVPVLAYLYLSSRPSSDTHRVVAQFEDAFPLIEGMNVRVDGAIAGSVGKVTVDDEGLAEVTLLLEDDVGPVRANASAAIRQQDTTGDSYVAFEPGSGSKPLPEEDGVPTIACRGEGKAVRCPRTLVAPRFDDVLSAFGPAERAGIQLTLSELAAALDRRGDDVNRAALDLRPGLASANKALDEVNSQNTALRQLIADAEAVSGQASSRRRSLERSLDGLAATLQTTAATSGSLDAGLARLPATELRARSTLAALRRAATAARPLATVLLRGATPLAEALGRAPGFLADLEAFLVRTRPTLALTQGLIRVGAPTIEADPSRVVTGPFDLAPAISNMLRGVLGEDETIEVLFNEKFGFGAVAREPGNQPGYPANFADRRFLRVSAILNCEGFGVKVKPGCLLDLLTGARAADRRAAKRDATRTESRRPSDEEPGRPGTAPQTAPAAPGQPAPAAPAPGAPAPQPQAPAPALPGVPALPALPAVPAPKPGSDPVKDILDFLFR